MPSSSRQWQSYNTSVSTWKRIVDYLFPSSCVPIQPYNTLYSPSWATLFATPPKQLPPPGQTMALFANTSKDYRQNQLITSHPWIHIFSHYREQDDDNSLSRCWYIHDVVCSWLDNSLGTLKGCWLYNWSWVRWKRHHKLLDMWDL